MQLLFRENTCKMQVLGPIGGNTCQISLYVCEAKKGFPPGQLKKGLFTPSKRDGESNICKSRTCAKEYFVVTYFA